jgi:hypothetical protein
MFKSLAKLFTTSAPLQSVPNTRPVDRKLEDRSIPAALVPGAALYSCRPIVHFAPIASGHESGSSMGSSFRIVVQSTERVWTTPNSHPGATDHMSSVAASELAAHGILFASV